MGMVNLPSSTMSSSYPYIYFLFIFSSAPPKCSFSPHVFLQQTPHQLITSLYNASRMTTSMGLSDSPHQHSHLVSVRKHEHSLPMSSKMYPPLQGYCDTAKA